MKYLTKDDVVERIRKAQGERNQAEFAREIGISPQYLCDIYQGRRDPGKSILTAVGLETVVRYKAVR